MDHTKELIVNAHNGDKQAREMLITENMGLIWSIVRRFSGRGYEIEDLFQIGSIGLIKAVDKFDMTFDVRFSTYAVPMITGEIKRFLRDDGMIKVSRTLKETVVKVQRAKEQITKMNGHEPTIDEISKEIGVISEEIVMALEAGSEIESLYKTIYQGDGNSILLIDKIEEDKNAHEVLINKMVLSDLIKLLTPKEQKIIEMRYFAEKTQTDIAKELGISQVQVSRLEKKILARMREAL